MELRFQCLGPDHWKTEVLLAPVFQGESLHEASPLLDKAAPWLAIAPAARDFRGKKNELSLLHGHPQQNVPRVLAIGLGKAEEFTPGVLREAVAAAVRRCRALEVEGLLLPEALLSRLPGGRDRLVEESAYAALLALYAFVIFRMLRLSYHTSERFGRLIIVGVASMLIFHMFENEGMNIGVMPITGVPLPFISYGGSNLIANMAGIGLVLNVTSRKPGTRATGAA